MTDSKRDPYRLIVESIKDYALLLLDVTGHVTSWNPGAQAIKGYTAEEILGKHFSIFYPPEDKGSKPAKELAIATREGRFEEEGWRVRKNGSRFWASVVITAAKDEQGNLIGFAKITRDLTEREKHRREIRALSTPVIRLWPGILLLPLVGDVDASRAEQVAETVLSRVVAEHATIIIIDVAGLPTMDTYVADSLLKTASMLRLLGTQTILTGIGARSAKTLVGLGVDLSAIVTQNQLAAGLELALSYLGKGVTDAKA